MTRHPTCPGTSRPEALRDGILQLFIAADVLDVGVPKCQGSRIETGLDVQEHPLHVAHKGLTLKRHTKLLAFFPRPAYQSKIPLEIEIAATLLKKIRIMIHYDV
jgi:hypothetical protein